MKGKIKVSKHYMEVDRLSITSSVVRLVLHGVM